MWWLCRWGVGVTSERSLLLTRKVQAGTLKRASERASERLQEVQFIIFNGEEQEVGT